MWWLKDHIRMEAHGFTVTSEPMRDFSFFKPDYSDIDAIFKSDPLKFKTEEKRDEHGHFHSYTVTTS